MPGTFFQTPPAILKFPSEERKMNEKQLSRPSSDNRKSAIEEQPTAPPVASSIADAFAKANQEQEDRFNEQRAVAKKRNSKKRGKKR